MYCRTETMRMPVTTISLFTPLRGNKVVASQRVISNNAVFGAHSAAVLCTISDLTKRCR